MNFNGWHVRTGLRPQWLRATEARVEGKVVHLGATAYGNVTRVLAAPGQLVEKGQLLIELDHRELDRKVEEATTELASAMGRALQAKAELTQDGMLSRVEIAPTPDVKLASARYTLALLRRSNTEVRAPIEGRVLETWVRPRDHVTLARRLLSLLDSDNLWVHARFTAPDFRRLHVGQRATVTTGEYVLEARVAAISRQADPVLLEFAEPYFGGLRPGTRVSVAVTARDTF